MVLKKLVRPIAGNIQAAAGNFDQIRNELLEEKKNWFAVKF